MMKAQTIFVLSVVSASLATPARAQSVSGVLVTRAELSATEARLSQSHGGDSQKNTMMAAAIRQRLRDGDFQVGDRIVVTVVANEPHTDTLIVRSGRAVELPARLGEISIPLAGILRSELQERMSVEILKYVKAAQIVVTPLVRVGILGEVARPGYFAFASDVPVTDAIMGAGGPSVNADLDRSVVKRGNREYRSPKETRDAIASGLTLDQFGLGPGDELVVGRRREFLSPALIGIVGVVGSLMTVFVALRH